MSSLAANLISTYREAPDQTALVLQSASQPDQTWSYRQLLDSSFTYALELARQAIQPGEVVILILEHGPELVSAFFGSILHGAVPSIMPFLTEKLSPEHYRASLSSLFEITAPAAVISSSRYIPDVEVALTENTSVRALINCEQIVFFEDISTNPKGLHRRPEDIVLLQHSSGTTGLQKGVALSHQAIENQVQSYRAALQLTDQDVIVSWLPLYHDMGLIAGFILPILSRVPLVLMSPFDWVRAPVKLLQAVSTYRGTLTWLPNFAYNFCAQKIRDRDLEGVDLSSWRAVINCSEPMYYESHQMFLKRFEPYGLHPRALATSYAMAENVFAVTQGGITNPVTIDVIDRQVLIAEQRAVPPNDADSALYMLSAGKPLDNTRVRVLDVNGIDLPERQIGEIAIQSNCMLSGYYHRPNITAQAFLDGWYLTGDLGYLAGGEIFVTGRKKDLIIVGGKNIYPQDIERLVNTIPGVHPGRVVAFGVPNFTTGTEDVVVIAETDGATAEEQTYLADQIRQGVNRGSDIALRYVELVDTGWLIKTSSGKIARNANRSKYLQDK